MSANWKVQRPLYSLIGAIVFCLGPANVVSDGAERPERPAERRVRELNEKAAKGRYTSVVDPQASSQMATAAAEEDEQPVDPNFDARGFSDRRDVGSLLPFEHVDPFTGNLLLTF